MTGTPTGLPAALPTTERRAAVRVPLDEPSGLLAQAASASVIACSWCMDFGYHAGHSKGLRVDTLREVPRWRESEAFSDLERAVLEHAEAMTMTPPAVDDAMAARLRGEIGDAAFVELTMMWP